MLYYMSFNCLWNSDHRRNEGGKFLINETVELCCLGGMKR